MKPGEWKELPTDNLHNDTLLYENVNGGTWYADKSVTWTNYLAWNPSSQEIYWVGAPHLVPFAFLRYSATQNRWYSETNVPDCMRLSGYDGCFTHGYHDGTIDPDKGIFYFNSGKHIFAYDIAKKAWSSWDQDDLQTGPGSALVYFPPLKKLAYAIGEVVPDGGMIQMIDPATHKLEISANKMPMGGYHNTMDFSIPERKLYFGGGNESNHFYSLDSAKKSTKLPDAPVPFTCIGTSLAVDPVSGEVLLLTADAFYAYKPSNNTWSQLPKPPVQLVEGTTTTAMAAAIPELGVIFYLSPSLERVYLYRHSPGAAPLGSHAPAAGKSGMIISQAADGSLTMNLPSDRANGRIDISDLDGRREASFPAAASISWHREAASARPLLVVWSEDGKTRDARMLPPLLSAPRR